jgi:hypothetical protein
MRYILIMTILMMAFLGGCVPSLYPLYTDSDLIRNPILAGNWVNGDSTETWEFMSASDSISYDLIQTEDEDSKHFEAYLLELDSVTYLDTYPDEEMKNDFYKIHLIPAHIFGKIELWGDSLGLSLLDSDWLGKKIDKGEISIEHKMVDNNLVLTASTSDLQKLFSRYAHDPSAFSERTVLYRR